MVPPPKLPLTRPKKSNICRACNKSIHGNARLPHQYLKLIHLWTSNITSKRFLFCYLISKGLKLSIYLSFTSSRWNQYTGSKAIWSERSVCSPKWGLCLLAQAEFTFTEKETSLSIPKNWLNQRINGHLKFWRYYSMIQWKR